MCSKKWGKGANLDLSDRKNDIWRDTIKAIFRQLISAIN